MKKNRVQLGIICLILGLTVLIVLFFSGSTSPLIDIVYSDYNTNPASTAIFIGSAWGSGYIPYKDLYIVEGPFFLLMQVLGWSFAGRTGIAIIQIIYLTLGLVVLYKVANRECERKIGFIAIICGCIFIAGTLNGGNTSAELCFTLTILGIYLLLKDAKHKGIIVGIILGALAMTDFTLGGALYGAVLYSIFNFWKQKKTKETVYFFGMLGIGFAIIVLPFLLYFAKADALPEFFNCVFIQNFKYMWLDVCSSTFFVKQLIKTMPTLLFIVLSGLHGRRDGLCKMWTAIGVGMFVSLLFSQGYWHLLIIETIAVVMTVVLIPHIFMNKAKNIIRCVVLCVCMFVAGWPMIHYVQFLHDSGRQVYYELIQQINELKSEEMETMFLVNAPAFIYLETEMMPSYYYFNNQREYSRADASIQEKVSNHMIYECEDKLALIQENGGTYMQIGDYNLIYNYSYDRTMLYLYQRGSEIHEH